MSTVSLEETDVRAALRVLRTLFGVPMRDDAAAHATTQALIQQLQQQVQTMSDAFQTELAQLQADVAAQGTVIASATTAFQGLAAQIAAAEQKATDAGATAEQIAAVSAVRQGLEANTAALASAIPQNTPAAGTDTTGGTAGATTPAAGTDTTGGGAATPATPAVPTDPNAPQGPQLTPQAT